jgi:hypothetical protein
MVHHDPPIMIRQHYRTKRLSNMFLKRFTTVFVIATGQSNAVTAWVRLDVPAATGTLRVRRHSCSRVISHVLVGPSAAALGTANPGTGKSYALLTTDGSMNPLTFHSRCRRSSTALALVRTPPKQSVSGGTFVEGDDYGSSLEEIEAMGGDPSFLGAYTTPTVEGSSLNPGLVEGELGGESFGWNVDVDEGWNGVVDENAHFDFN